MIRDTGSIELNAPPGRPRTIRTRESIQKVKTRLNIKKPVSTRKLSRELNISRTSVRRILKDDLALRPYKKIVEPRLTDEHKKKRKTFSNWIRTNFRKEDSMKMFDIDGIYNSQNDRVWAASRVDANKKGDVKEKRKFPKKVMVWLAVCSEGVSPIVILEEGMLDHRRYIQEILPVAVKYGNDVFGNH